MAEPDATDSLCAMVDKKGGHACSGCHSIRYCSKLCQKTDWHLHKILSKSFKDFSDDTRPQKDDVVFKRAIFFPEDGDSPEFMWISSRGPDESGRVRLQLPLFNGQQLHSLEVLDYDLVLMRPLKDSIGLLSGGWPVGMGSMSQVGGSFRSGFAGGYSLWVQQQ